MAASFVAAAAARSADVALPKLRELFASRLAYDSSAWTIELSSRAGRSLVAAGSIPAGTRVFTERPIIIAARQPIIALTATVATRVLELERTSSDFAAACVLQPSEGGCLIGSAEWAREVAVINVHDAGGTAVDPTRRGVLGLLSSMMQHECSPSCVLKIAPAEKGSLVSLYTIRDVQPGELLSISYVGAYQTTSTRQELLRTQHGFVCSCARCSRLPEMTRAFRCPNCGEGPASPASPALSCRELQCDDCEVTMRLDDAAWARLEAAECCPVVCEEMMAVLRGAPPESNCRLCRAPAYLHALTLTPPRHGGAPLDA